MKKLISLFAIFAMLLIGVNTSYAQTPPDSDTTVTENDTVVVEEIPKVTTEEDVEDLAEVEEVGMHKQIKTKFIEGGAGFMGIVLIILILGLAMSLERIIYLTLASTNTDKLLKNVENALESGGVEEAKEVCRSTRGPVASIFYQGLDRSEHGIEVVEKAVVSYGSVQMGMLEKGLSWLSLFISIAPMLGFMGTVIGMIGAFDSIQQAGEISAGLVAGGIKVALITTVSGLIVAIILQVFYNLIVSIIDGLVNKMEDASISLIDILIKHNLKNK